MRTLHQFIMREAASTGQLKEQRHLSAPRRALLERLQAAGGSVTGKSLTVPARRLASRMERDGLVAWDVGEGDRRDSSTWVLRMLPPAVAVMACGIREVTDHKVRS